MDQTEEAGVDQVECLEDAVEALECEVEDEAGAQSEEGTCRPGIPTLKNLQIELAGALAPANLLKPGKIRGEDIPKLKKFYALGMTHEELADIFGVTREAITHRVKKLGLARNHWTPSEFKQRMETEMLDRMQKLLNAMSVDKVEKASLSQLIMAFGILFDKVRLQRGESTQNVAALQVHKLDPGAIASIKEIIAQQTERKLAETRKTYPKEG